MTPGLTLSDLDSTQRNAVELICTAPIGIVTGGPGTGKTSCLRAALDMMDGTSTRYKLCAPTGKAARRMTDSTGREAMTIHRALGFRPGVGWTCNEHSPIDADVVVVDEASMLDVELGAALIRALGDARLVLVGDANQLPPVGPGQLFADLVESGQVLTVRLTELHRSAAQAWISTSAPIVLAGKVPPLTKRSDFEYERVRSAASVLQGIRRVIEPADMQARAQVLIPMRDGACGTTEANIMLQSVLNPAPPGPHDVPRDKHAIRVGDRVIHTVNNYALGVFNGEIGQVMDITRTDVIVQYPENTVTYVRSRSDERALELAYALTIHKSQGSEFPWVVVVVHSTHTIMLNRKLFYTAITRAKEGVVLVGDDAGLDRAVGTGFVKTRLTTLIERIEGTEDPILFPHGGGRT